MVTTAPVLLTPTETAAAADRLRALRQALGQVLFGQDDLLDLVVIALAARGHVLLEGLPGLGKTELVKALGGLLGLTFKRVQFTPDLMPSDITGGPILQEEAGRRVFVFARGPIFTHLLLADEINRASPKTQSALLEAMQERSVTTLGETHALPEPFFVLATQNPIELEGTYPLPEAQLDRFLFKVEVPSVGREVLARIVAARRGREPVALLRVLDEAALRAVFAAADRVFLPNAVADWIARLVEASHPRADACPVALRPYLRFGASPRAAIAIAESARASALLDGRPNAGFEDAARVAVPALAHRLVLDHAARLAGKSAGDVARALVAATAEVAERLPS